MRNGLDTRLPAESACLLPTGAKCCGKGKRECHPEIYLDDPDGRTSGIALFGVSGLPRARHVD